MHYNLKKISRNMRATCFVLLISTTVLADKFKEIQLCDKNTDEKCVRLTYEQGQLVVKNSDNKDATLNIAKASFSDDVVFGKKIMVTDRAGFACTGGNYDNCKSWINPTNATFRSIDVIGDANFSSINSNGPIRAKGSSSLENATFTNNVTFSNGFEVKYGSAVFPGNVKIDKGYLYYYYQNTSDKHDGWYRLGMNNETKYDSYEWAFWGKGKD